MLSRVLLRHRSRHLTNLTKSQLRTRLEHGATLIDVRRFEEVNVGVIKTPLGSRWIHIPLNELEDALHLDSDEFVAQFETPKPSINDELIFYCMKGVRSKHAGANFEQNGYTNVSNYLGGWWEWNEHWTKNEWLEWFKEANYPVKEHWLEKRYPVESLDN